MNSKKKYPSRGRPRKFKENSRPITITLPQRVLDRLDALGPDRARAIVKCVDMALEPDGAPVPPVDLLEIEAGKALIVVGSNRQLAKIEWLRRIEISPGRFLLLLPSGTMAETLEVTINDILDHGKGVNAEERILLAKLRDVLARHRRGKGIHKAELILLDPDL